MYLFLYCVLCFHVNCDAVHVRYSSSEFCVISGVRQTQAADLQTSRLADSKICRPTFFVTGLWANFIHPLFTVGESQSMSEANNSASELQTQQCPIRQVTGNPCRGRLNIGRTVT